MKLDMNCAYPLFHCPAIHTLAGLTYLSLCPEKSLGALEVLQLAYHTLYSSHPDG
jgi:hypothetical protein